MMAKASTRVIREKLGALFSSELETMRRENPGIGAALVCTADGFAVASAHADEETSRRLAAIVSSLHALGAAVVEDMTLGTYSHLSIEATAGKCIVFGLPSSGGRLLLGAVADESVPWGRLLACAGSSCEGLDRLLQQRSDDFTAGPATGPESQI
jgi:predicted regulator of Ras-like GTPase activity (Roadblock/LC7/MglB family)